MADPHKKAALFDQLARVGKALGNGKRLELVDLLSQGERTVEAVAAAAGLGFSTTSAHLQTLKAAGLVSTRRDGTRIFYRLAGDDVAALYAHARDVAAAHVAEVEVAARTYLGDAPQQVGREEFLDRLATGDVVVLDVRPQAEYEAGHIPEALSIPIEELPARLEEIPGDAQIVAYCRGTYCVFAHDAVRLLADNGHAASRLAEGMLEWRLAGLPVEAGT